MSEIERVHMNPNSEHQLWSLWTFTVRPNKSKPLVAFGARRKIQTRPRAFEDVKLNCARFGRKAFGSAGQMNVAHYSDGTYVVKCRVEGHPVHDPAYVEHQRASWTRFFVTGFGVGTTVTLETKLEAGDAEMGKPRDQLIIVPPVHIGVESNG